MASTHTEEVDETYALHPHWPYPSIGKQTTEDTKLTYDTTASTEVTLSLISPNIMTTIMQTPNGQSEKWKQRERTLHIDLPEEEK